MLAGATLSLDRGLAWRLKIGCHQARASGNPWQSAPGAHLRNLGVKLEDISIQFTPEQTSEGSRGLEPSFHSRRKTVEGTPQMSTVCSYVSRVPKMSPMLSASAS